MRTRGLLLVLAMIAVMTPAAAAEPSTEELQAEASTALSSRRFAQAGRQYEELFARTGRPEYLLAAAWAIGSIPTPEAKATAIALAQRYRELTSSGPVAVAGVPSATAPAATSITAEPPPSLSAAPPPPPPPAVRPMETAQAGRVADDNRLRALLAVDAGALVGIGVEGFSGAFAGGFSGRFTWPMGKHVELGLRQTLHFTVLPVANWDGTPIIGSCERCRLGGSPYAPPMDALIFIPTTSVALTLVPVPIVRVHLSAGVGLLAASELKLYSLFPRYVGALGVDFVVSRGEGFQATLGAEADASNYVLGDVPTVFPRARFGVLFFP